MIQLKPKHHKIVSDIVKQFPFQFYVYGSRAKGAAREFSDLDICIMEGSPTIRQLDKLDELFEESDLPFTVDVIVWNKISKNFQDLIKNDLILFE